MDKGRLEAFSDGVIAVIITIMVLDLKAPEGGTFAALVPQVPIFVTYVLSFVNVGLYWNNHHHLLHATGKIDGRVLWANLHLLFWLSLMPITTAWAGEHRFTTAPTATYGFDLLMCGIAYVLLQNSIVAVDGPGSDLARAMGRDWKGKASMLGYLVAIPLAFVVPVLSASIYVAIAALWFVPDRRIERLTKEAGPSEPPAAQATAVTVAAAPEPAERA